MIRLLSAVAVAAAAVLGASVSHSFSQRPAAPSGGSGFRLLETTISDVEAALRSGQLTCRGLVEAYIMRIEAYDKAGPKLNAVQTINPHALVEADRLDAVYKSSGPMGPLHCVPILVKDQILSLIHI